MTEEYHGLSPRTSLLPCLMLSRCCSQPSQPRQRHARLEVDSDSRTQVTFSQAQLTTSDSRFPDSIVQSRHHHYHLIGLKLIVKRLGLGLGLEMGNGK